MKTVYKDTRERIERIITRAEEDDQEIDYIELNLNEWFSLHRKLDPNNTISVRETTAYYRGIELRRIG